MLKGFLVLSAWGTAQRAERIAVSRH